MIPPALSAGIDRLLQGVSRIDLARRAAAISGVYRQGNPSRQAIISSEDALAYLVTRMPATYAAVKSSLLAIKSAMPDFRPMSLLDAGAGPGTASWAARTVWPELAVVTLFDENLPLMTLGGKLAGNDDVLARADWRQGSLQNGSLPPADLVIASYALGEMREGTPLVQSLFAAAKGVLVLIEPGTPAGYDRIVRWRAQLLGLGATIVAPCTHDAPCPIVAPDWCHFSQRLSRGRDHKLLKNAEAPFEDEKFSYVAATILPLPARANGRILAPAALSKGEIVCKVCTEGRIEPLVASRRDREAYKRLRKKSWGDEI